MTRHRLTPIRDQPDQRGGAIHPLAQAVRLLTEWLAAGPLTGREIDRLAAQRGLSPSWVGQAIWTLVNRREVTETGSGRDTTYRLIHTHPRRKEPKC